ncbi:hypothetical protein K710_0074 [Streptococcus iniae SF1]|nr:hypothetical protein K710_0074 [Streptococcus iniae SF1]
MLDGTKKRYRGSIMAERFYDVLAMVWIGIAGADSRWEN